VRELPRGSAGQWLAMVALTVRNYFLSWSFFLPGFVINLLQMFSAAAIFYLMGQLVAPGATPHVERYGVSYGAYIVVGLLLNRVMQTMLTAFHEALLNSYWGNQLNTYFQYPGGISAYLTGNLLSQLIVVALQALAYVVVGVSFFGVTIAVANVPDVLAILALTIAALSGLGLAGASAFTWLNAKRWGSNPVEWLMGFAVTLLAGVYFPPTVLPEWLQRVAEWLPQTHALRAARLTLAGQATLLDPAIAGDLVFLLAFTLVSLPVGALLFATGLRKGLRDGTFIRWN
jgi:ABC-2 type transport system permease protein